MVQPILNKFDQQRFCKLNIQQLHKINYKHAQQFLKIQKRHKDPTFQLHKINQSCINCKGAPNPNPNPKYICMSYVLHAC